MKKIILASKSPRRKSLLKQLGLNFVVIASGAEESLNPRLKPRGQAEVLSLKKAEAVADVMEKKKENKEYVIISADTIVSVDNEVLGKPKDGKEAKRMLRKLSGRRHSVVTGFTIIDTVSKKIVTKSVETYVYFKILSEKEMRDYVEKETLIDKAGAYAIQGVGAVFIEKIEGDYNNVVGLPLCALALELKKFGIEIL